MEIGVTKAVQKRLKSITVEATNGVSPVFCWDTHLVKAKGRNYLLRYIYCKLFQNISYIIINTNRLFFYFCRDIGF